MLRCTIASCFQILVRTDKIADYESSAVEIARQYNRLGPTGATPFGWMTEDLHESGAVGNAALADAATGKRIVKDAAQAFAELLQEVGRFDLSALK